ncbi:hypothetical protein NP233_g6069 [Leucocoprinus birnbaumii]|uniref:DnaJ-domain-containing protein n=1 Tax=Leucocoprinus birnbaumii TaxID=56174 RepID=A0AAD5VV60_9AGAR|nr:hypothetical protein NP233_g6069 [Leucocoprinus birnbaumii]
MSSTPSPSSSPHPPLLTARPWQLKQSSTTSSASPQTQAKVTTCAFRAYHDLILVAVGEIKKAYRKKAMEHHPDKNINDPEAGVKFQEIGAAYEILSDSQTRHIYDTHGMEGLSGQGASTGPGLDDLFEQFFGGGGGGPSFGFNFGPGPKRRKGEDTIVPYDVTLEDLYNGKSVKLNMEKESICSTCKGSGAKGSAKPKSCFNCGGKGWTFVQTQIAANQLATSRAQCRECKGEGELLKEKDRCKKCKGSKTVKEKVRQEIFVEKGMTDRQRIVLAGAGDEEPGIPAGDVIIQLKAQPHESFERSGNDLLTRVKITLSEALLGFSRVLVTHLDGRGIKVSSLPGKIIKPDQTIVLRGEGMPIYKRSDEKGDLYVVLSFEMPDDSWLQAINKQALESILPPKKGDIEPRPSIVDDVEFEETDLAEVRSRSYPAGPNFFDQGFPYQFGEGDEADWIDDEDDDEFGDHNADYFGFSVCVSSSPPEAAASADYPAWHTRMDSNFVSRAIFGPVTFIPHLACRSDIGFGLGTQLLPMELVFNLAQLACFLAFSITSVESLPARILIFSRTVEFRHDSIPTAINALQSHSSSINVVFDQTEDQNLFTDENLQKYDALLFLDNTGEVLDDPGKTAFQNYLNKGGNFVAVHSASDCLRTTEFYDKEIGAYFDYHPALQNATVDVIDFNHPSTVNLPAEWEVTDEIYNFKSDPRSIGATMLLAANESSYVVAIVQALSIELREPEKPGIKSMVPVLNRVIRLVAASTRV